MLSEFLINLEAVFNSVPFLGIGIAFIAGIIVSLSPCIYPLIPITIGIIGAVSVSTRFRGFLITLVFVLGVSVVYTLLGVLSSLFGVILGNILINPITYLVLACIFIILGLSLLGNIKIKWPVFNFWNELDSRKGLVSVFILGAISALAIIPCNFPVLGAILTLIASKKSVFYGAAALFSFSLGYGLILLIIGTSVSLIKKLPKYSRWFDITKGFAAITLVMIGLYFFLKFLLLST